MLSAHHARDVGRQRFRRQRAGGHDDRIAPGRRRDREDLLADDRDERVRLERARDLAGKTLAVHGERGAGRHAAGLGGAHDERAEPPHFFFQKADRVVQFVAAEGVAADELRETVGLVNGGRPHGPHFVQPDRHAPRGCLPGGFGSGQPAADDGDHFCYAADSGTAESGRASERA